MVVNSKHTALAVVRHDRVDAIVMSALDKEGLPIDGVVIFTGYLDPCVVLCFVDQDDGEDTLLIAGTRDHPNKILECSMTGTIVRSLETSCYNMRGLAYDGHERILAIADSWPPCLQLISYASWTVVWNIHMPDDLAPSAVTFTPDGRHVLVADETSVVRKYDVGSRALVASVASNASNGIMHAIAVLVTHGGELVVGCRHPRGEAESAVVCVDRRGVTRKRVTIPDHVTSLAWVVGGAFCCGTMNSLSLHECPWWSDSLRCAWVTACVAV
jgi:hypothetical protein